MPRTSRLTAPIVVAALLAVPVIQIAAPGAAHAAATARAANGSYNGTLHVAVAGAKQTAKITIAVRHHNLISHLIVRGVILDSPKSTGQACGAVNRYDSKQLADHVRATHTRISHGRFAVTFNGKFDKVVLKGKVVTSHKIHGTVRETTAPDPLGDTCDSGSLTYTAKR